MKYFSIVLLLSMLSSAAFSDVVLEGRNIEMHNKVLYFKNGDYLERRVCSKELVGPITADQCFTAFEGRIFWPRRLELSLLNLYIYKRITKNLPELESTNAQIFKSIDLIDNKFNEILNSEPQANGNLENLNQLITKRKEAYSNYLTLQSQKRNLQDQLAAIELQLKTSRNPEIIAEAARLVQEIADSNKKLNETMQELEQTQKLIANFDAGENLTIKLNALRQQRSLLSGDYLSNLQKIEDINKRYFGIKIFIKNFIDDDSFTYELTNSQIGTEAFPFEEAKAFISDFESAYKLYENKIAELDVGHFNLPIVSHYDQATGNSLRRYFRWFRCGFKGRTLWAKPVDCEITIVLGDRLNPTAKTQKIAACEIDSLKVQRNPELYDQETINFVDRLTTNEQAQVNGFSASIFSPTFERDASFVGFCEGAYAFGEPVFE